MFSKEINFCNEVWAIAGGLTEFIEKSGKFDRLKNWAVGKALGGLGLADNGQRFEQFKYFDQGYQLRLAREINLVVTEISEKFECVSNSAFDGCAKGAKESTLVGFWCICNF